MKDQMISKLWLRLSVCICAIALTFAAAMLTGCSSNESSSSSNAEAQTITDMRGRSVEIPADLERIVAVGCALRPVCYLQAEDMVVGVEASEQEDNVSCAYRHVNHDLFASLPVIGDGGSSGVTINEEALMEAAPQLVICDSISADEADNLQQKTGIPFVCLDQPETVFDDKYYNNLELLGKVLGKEERAAEVVNYIKEVDNDLEQRSAASENADNNTAYAAGISFRGGHGFDGTEANFQPFVACNIDNVADGHGSDGAFTIDLETVSAAHQGELQHQPCLLSGAEGGARWPYVFAHLLSLLFDQCRARARELLPSWRDGLPRQLLGCEPDR